MTVPGLREVRFAIRFLRRHRAFTATSAAILALGVAMSTTLFAVVNGALITPWPYRGADRIVTTRGNYPEQGRSGFALWSPAEIRDLQQSVISQSLQERGREIWIRLALGASPRATFRAELGTGARLAGVAGVLGAALAVVVERATAAWVPDAHGSSPVTIGLAILIVGTLALAFTAPAAYRAASAELAGVARE